MLAKVTVANASLISNKSMSLIFLFVIESSSLIDLDGEVVNHLGLLEESLNALISAIGLIFNSLAQMPYSKLLGHGMAKQTSILHIVELLIYIPSLYYFTSGFGILGASSVWSGRMLIDLIAMTIMNNYIPPKEKS